MKERTRKILITVSALATSFAFGTYVFIKIRNNTIRKNLDAALGGGVGQYGDLKDIPGFKGKGYQDSLKSITSTQPVIKLQDAEARSYADKIENAWGKLNDDEDAIYAVFRSLKDNYALSQVASVYEALKYGNLLNVLEDKLSTDEQNEIYKIARLYKPYRIAI